MTVLTIVIDKAHSDLNTFIATDVKDLRDIEYTFAHRVELMIISIAEAFKAEKKETV